MWDGTVAVAQRSSGVPRVYPVPSASCTGNGEHCRVQANSSSPLLTPYGLNKDLGVFRAGSMSLGPVLMLVWDLENLNVLCGNPPPTTAPARACRDLSAAEASAALAPGKGPCLVPSLAPADMALG